MSHSSLRRLALKCLAAGALLGCLIAPPALAADGVLRVSAIPDEAPTELQRKFEPLGKYLAAQTGMKVVFTPVSDYAAVVEALASGKVDLAWLGGFTFVQARIRSHGAVIPLVQRAEDAKFTSRFITADPAIKSLVDLKGKTFVFGSPSSTSGSLMPRYYLLQAGVDPERDFRTVAYSGAHDATAAYVAAGRAEAGVLNTAVWDELVEQKKIDPARVHVFATTPTYFDYNWTVRRGLDPALVNRLKEAFLKLDPARPQDKAILDLQRASRFVPTSAANYAGIEQAARAAGLLK